MDLLTLLDLFMFMEFSGCKHLDLFDRLKRIGGTLHTPQTDYTGGRLELSKQQAAASSRSSSSSSMPWQPCTATSLFSRCHLEDYKRR
jgi:hypothetical protein